jgi:hypothetical protein
MWGEELCSSTMCVSMQHCEDVLMQHAQFGDARPLLWIHWEHDQPI